MSSTKGEIGKFHILVVPQQQGNVQKCWMHMHNTIVFLTQTSYHFFVILIAAVLLSLSWTTIFLSK